MQFADLNEEIGADDWLIPESQISRRRLIRRTPRYNIYKADWYGDVLVYEPTEQQPQQQQQSLSPAQERKLSLSEEKCSCSLDLTATTSKLRSQLQSLNLQLPTNATTKISSYSDSLRSRLDSGQLSPVSDCGSIDSAYSSVSSTPLYNHARQKRSEFEFPTAHSDAILRIQDDENNNNNYIDVNNNSCQSLTEKTKLVPTGCATRKGQISNIKPSPLLLNKDSYNFRQCHATVTTTSHGRTGQNLESAGHDITERKQSSTWSELNELRLIAHESFMLFMGASMVEETFSQSSTTSQAGASLVMQMNNPKAISLYNLLHGSKFATSPLNRFFGPKQQHLSLDTKLNICQQVTNAMTYLHDKNIVHCKLTSLNVYLEPNQSVKISLLDDDTLPIISTGCPAVDNCSGKAVQLNQTQHSSACSQVRFNLPALTYLSPELIKTISVNNNQHQQVCGSHTTASIDDSQMTASSDVFSFGTLMFELFEGRFPFSADTTMSNTSSFVQSYIGGSPVGCLSREINNNEPSAPWNGNIDISAQELVYQIGSGSMAERNLDTSTSSGDKTSTIALVKQVIQACWSYEPHMRPKFKQLWFSHN